jgi:hypothetical protein
MSKIVAPVRVTGVGIGGERLDFTAALTYSAEDPYAVLLDSDAWVWGMSRSLLLDGMSRPTGDGDVRVMPVLQTLISFDLRSPDGHATLFIARSDVEEFIRLSEAMVPLGHEKWEESLMRQLRKVLNGAR